MREYLIAFRHNERWSRTFTTLPDNMRMTREVIEEIEKDFEEKLGGPVIITSFQLLEEPY